MAKFGLYNISLKNLAPGKHLYQYDLDKKFFDTIDGEDVRKGKVNVELTVTKTASTFEFNFDLKGVIQISCTRCLDDMEHEVETHNKLIVKLGPEYSEESDEVLIIPEDDPEINIAWFLYEFIVLSIPIKHTHEPGKCNKAMSMKYNKHRAVSAQDNDPDDEMFDNDLEINDEESTETNIDPRWDVLKELNLEDN